MPGFLYFLAVFIASIFCFRWLHRAARASAGVSFEEELRYQRSVRHQPKSSKHVARWLVQRSSQPRKTRLLLNLATLCPAPAAACTVFYPVPALKQTVSAAAIVLPVFALAGAVAGLVYARRDPFHLPLKEKWRLYKEIAIDEEIEEFYKDKKGPRWKHDLAGLGKLMILVAVMASIVALLMNLGEKRPQTTAQQMLAAMEAQGCAVTDQTDYYREVWDAYEQVHGVLIGENDTMRLEFFLFDTDRSAQNVHGQLVTKLREYEDMSDYTEYTHAEGNYAIYALETGAVYCLDIRVGSTVLYGSCPKEHAAQLKEFAQSLGYF